MKLSIGATLPEASFLEKGVEGIGPVASGDLFSGRVVLFGLPGAFTGVCSTQHLPSFIRVADALRGKGIDAIGCVAVNDPFVMQAWGEGAGATAAGIRMLSDADGAFTRAIDMAFDAPAAGLFDRSQRYALMAEGGVVKVLNVEASGGVCDISGGETMLAAL